MTARRVAILTSGGDAPGMNTAIRAAVIAGVDAGCDMIGIRDGFRGVVAGTFDRLTAGDVSSIQGRGGTILGTARCPELVDPSVRARARAVLTVAGIDAVIVIGGDGSMRGAAALGADGGPRMIGVPASIDNDLAASCSIGADTALNTIVDACDRLGDTADAHDRAFLIEVMGRDSGWLARSAAEAMGADAVVYPEAGRSEDDVIADVVAAIRRARARPGARRVLVIKAEGVAVPIDRLKRRVDAALVGAAAIETRTIVLGHLVRGGAPTGFDRVLAAHLGRTAMRAALAGAGHVMVAWRPPVASAAAAQPDGQCRLIDLDQVVPPMRVAVAR